MRRGWGWSESSPYNPTVGRRIVAVVLAILPTLALANGAMGLGLEIFDLRYWCAYVVATVVFEAWMIGGFMGKSAWPSLGISLIANFASAFPCFVVCPVFLHDSFVGTRLNPNPLMNSIAILVVAGLISTFIETLVWNVFKETVIYKGSILVQSLKTHLLGVPLALAILLIPPRPYRGTESMTRYYRRMQIIGYLIKRIQALDENALLPREKTFPEVWAKLPAWANGPDNWAAGYLPEFGRFATGENRKVSFGEWNPAVSGHSVQWLYENSPIWLLRWRYSDGTAQGIVFGLTENHKGLTQDPKELGYDELNRDQSPR